MALTASLLDAATRGDDAQLTRLLRVKSCDVNVQDENGCSALQRAAADGHIEVLQVLLRNGADSNKQDIIHGNTAAHEAAWKGYSRCVSLLAAAGADLRVRNYGGFAPLHLACQNGHNQSCREILLAGAPPDIQNNYGDTALHTAARYGHAGVTRILISAQCKVSEQNENGDTALHIAAAMGRRKLTRILLEAGCDKTVRNRQGETARDIAQRKGLDEIINILNTPAAKPDKKKAKRRDKSKERNIDEPKPKEKGKKKKTVHFEQPAVNWSPYGCHYYPDPKFFPKPKLSSLPTEPLKKGEQYYLDLAGNIKKGPVGAGYTCYCAPFFKHMEDKLTEDKKDLKRHIDRAHDKLDQKVTDLEIKTQGQITELTRYVAVERALCKERHEHLEQWVTRGMIFRSSERVKRLDFSPRGSLDIPPLKRTRSLEILDTSNDEWNRVNRIIRNFNKNSEQFESSTKELNNDKATSKSTELLDAARWRQPQSPRRNILKNSKSSDQLDSAPSRSSRSPFTTDPNNSTSVPESEDNLLHNVTAEIHVKSNQISISQSPLQIEVQGHTPERYICPPSRQSHSKSPSSSIRQGSDYRASDSEGDVRLKNVQFNNRNSPQYVPNWKSQVLQRTTNDIRNRVLLEKDQLEVIQRDTKSCLDISHDGYVKIPKQHVDQNDGSHNQNETEQGSRISVQEMIAHVEKQQILRKSPTPYLVPRNYPQPSEMPQITPNVSFPTEAKVAHQPLRPAPILKEKSQKSKRFSLHNLIPFPTRKSFQTPKVSVNNSESSDEEDSPIRTTTQPGPMNNSNLLQTLPLPNYENMSNKSQSPNIHTQSPVNYTVHDLRMMIPKDAYFHEIPNRPITHGGITENGLPVQLANVESTARNRNPLCHQTGLFDAMMQDHVMREIERTPQCYSERLDQNTEIEIAKQNDHFRDNYFNPHTSGLPIYPPVRVNSPQGIIKKPMQPDHKLLHSRLQSLAISTNLSETQSQADRESHNDSGYSTKVYGSSQGPSPSLSGHVESADCVSNQKIVIPNGKTVRNCQISASSLV